MEIFMERKIDVFSPDHWSNCILVETLCTASGLTETQAAKKIFTQQLQTATAG